MAAVAIPVMAGPAPTDADERMAEQGVYVPEYSEAKEMTRHASETTEQARTRSYAQYGAVVGDAMAEFKGLYAQFSDSVVHRMQSGPELPLETIILRPALWAAFNYRRRILVRLPIMPWRGALLELLQLINDAPPQAFPSEVAAIVEWFSAHEAYHQLLLNAGNLWADYCRQLRHSMPPEVASFCCGCNTTVRSPEHVVWVSEANRMPLCERMHRLSPAHYRFRELTESKHSYERRAAFLTWARKTLRAPCPTTHLDEHRRLLALVRMARRTLQPCPHEACLPAALRAIFAQIRGGLNYQSGYTGEGLPNLADPILSMDCTVLLGHWRMEGDARFEARHMMGLPDEDDDGASSSSDSDDPPDEGTDMMM